MADLENPEPGPPHGNLDSLIDELGAEDPQLLDQEVPDSAIIDPPAMGIRR